MSPALDLRNQATHPIRLGASILKPSSSSRFSSVRYNHKSKIADPEDSTSSIIPGEDGDYTVLSLKDGDEEYTYSGTHADAADTYVLVVANAGDNQDFVLEKLCTTHAFNLTSTPSETSASKLAERYPQLMADGQEDEAGLFGDEDASADTHPDSDNPYDYRHFLKKATAAAREAPRSTAGTPARTSTNTPSTRPTRPTAVPAPQLRKRKQETKDMAFQQKRVKVSHPPATQKKSDVPSLRIDRRASTRRISLDDSGELVLEGETPVSAKPGKKQQSSLALALSGQLGQGPISLRSAASSPASRIASPMPSQGETEEIDLGGDGPAADEDADADADADEEDDADVEELELPSPAQVHRPSVSGPTVTGGDDDDDLEAQMMMAMAEDEDGGTAAAAPESDEEVSEEE